MKTFSVALGLFLVIKVAFPQVPEGFPVLATCCVATIRRPIPLARLSSYYTISNRCSLPAVVFVTKRGLRVCAEPQEEWVQDRMNRLNAN